MGHEVVADVVAVGPKARGSGGRAAGGAQPVAVVRAARHRTAVPRLRERRLQPVLELRRRRHQTRHPHRGVGRRDRRIRRVDAGPRQHAVRGARLDSRRDGRVRRPVLGVPARDHPPPAAPLGPGSGVRGRLAGVVRGRDPAGALPRRGGGRRGALRGPGRAGPAVRGRQSAGARTAAGRHRGAGRLGRRPAAPAAAGAADGLSRSRSTSSTTPSASRRRSRLGCGSSRPGGRW